MIGCLRTRVCKQFEITSRRGCFTLVVFLLSCGCPFSMSFPHGAMGWSVYCDCGISWSFSVFSLWCHGFVCVLWLWHFLVILCIFLMVPLVGLCTVIVEFPGHSVYFPHGAMGLSLYCDCGIFLSICVFSPWCHGVVCILWLWHFLVILCIYLMVPWVCLCLVIVGCSGHSVSFPHGAIGFVCVLWLWHFLVILCVFLMVPWVCQYTVIVAFPGHSVSLPHDAIPGAHPSGKSQGNLFFLQGQGKVRECCKMVREIRNFQKSGKSQGILKSCLVNPSKIKQTNIRWWL